MGQEFIGVGSIQQLGSVIEELRPERVLIVSGKKSYELSGSKKVLEGFLEGIDFQRYSDFEENPKFDDLIKGAQLVRKYNPDLVLAVGGGSVMDTAKIISVLPGNLAQAERIVKGEEPVPGKIAPLAAIPTTSGSGSEATHFAVAYIGNDKYSVAGGVLLPDYVIVDPELTNSLPPYQTAVSGMDALCQAIESWWAKGATDESRRYAAEAIHLLYPNLEPAVNRPDPPVRLTMGKGAHLAGKAINISKTTAPHALSYGITTLYGIPHGHAVALTMGEFLVYNAGQAAINSGSGLKVSMAELFNMLGCDHAEECRDQFQTLMKSVGLETKLGILAGDALDIQKLVDLVNPERLGNHPFAITKTGIQAIYSLIL